MGPEAQKPLTLQEVLNRPAKRVVFRRDTGLGQGVEKRGFAHVGQAHNATLQTHEIPLENGGPV